MNTLVISLPLPDEPADSLRFVLGHDAGSGPLSTAPIGQLPPAQEVVAVVPSAMLSWHWVKLPKTPQARWRQALEGVLEERLLADTASLHLAVAPGAAGGSAVWVAACSKPWLQAALQALQTAGQQVTRVVPEHEPLTEGQATRWLLAGQPENAQLLRLSEQGVLCLPLGTPSSHSLQAALTALTPTSATETPRDPTNSGANTGASTGAIIGASPADLTLHAEPALGALANRALGRPVPLQSAAQTLLAAAQSDWNLAQFDLASTGSQRWLKRLAERLAQALKAPAWRPVRWGLTSLLAAQLLGLNLWAWQENTRLQAKQAAVKNLFTQAFPQVTVVIDAPLQMERESAALAQARGLPAAGDLESLLAAVAQAGGPAPTALKFAPGELSLTGFEPTDAQALTAQLKAQGYSAQRDGALWTVRPAAESKP